MKYAIVDIGSNTVRLNLYEVDAKKKIKELLNKKTVAGLSSYIVDGQMTRKGGEKLIKILKGYLEICRSFKINQVHLFATAALRNAKNSKEVLRYIEAEIDHKIQILDGEEEAYLGYMGILEDYQIEDGYIVDIGGGSVEITLIQGGQISFSTSLKEGHLSMYKKYIKGVLPREKEVKKISKKVVKDLKKEAIPTFEKPVTVYGVGGTIRACGNISQELFDLPSNKVLYPVTVKNLKDLLVDEDKKAISTALQVSPARIHTMGPGLVILDTLLDYLGARDLKISSKGVREGYLAKLLD